MADDPKQPLDLPPFPPLRWRQSGWAGRVVLSSWAGFQSRLGAYAGAGPGSAPDGTVRIRIAAPTTDPPAPPSPEQLAAYEYLLAHQDTIRDILLAAIFEEFPTIRANMLADGIVDPAAIPELASQEDLEALIGL